MSRRARSTSQTRSRSRSKSRTSRSRSRSRGSGGSLTDSYSDYSDSYYSDDQSRTATGKKAGAKKSFKSNASSNTYTNKVAKGGGGKGGKKGRTSKQTTPRGGATSGTGVMLDNVTKRMLSGRRMKINELRNETNTLNTQLTELRSENKELKRQSHINERALDRFEYQEGELPSIINKHNEEIRTLKEHVRKQKDKYAKCSKKLKDTDDELDRTKRLLRKMKGLVEDKELAERDVLSRKLSKAEGEVEEKNRKVQDLERHIENLNKNGRHQVGIEQARHRETQIQLRDLQEQFDKMQSQLKEKEKELEVRNIYANRIMKPPHKLNSSVRSTPTIPPIGRSQRTRKKSDGGMTAKERSKMYESQRREEEKRKREEKERDERDERQRQYDEDKAAREKEEAEWQRKMDRDRSEEEAQRKRRQEEQDQEESEEEERRWREERERRKKEAGLMRDREDKADKARREKDERDGERRRQQEEEDSKHRHEQEKRERERKEREERERREREEQDRRRQEEALRLANDDAEQERRRQKDLLLAKMQAIDDKTVGSNGDSTYSPTNKKKDWQFTKPIENMHQGLPAYEDAALNRTKKNSFEDSDDNDSGSGGYKPTFLQSSKPPQNHVKSSPTKTQSKGGNNNKANLMNDLFGSAGKKKSKDSLFGSANAKNNRASDTVRTQHREGSGMLFAGGSALVDDDEAALPIGNNANLLPRRPRQQATAFHTRPTVNAVDDLDDELEEVIL